MQEPTRRTTQFGSALIALFVLAACGNSGNNSTQTASSPGITDTTIQLGETAPFSGPLSFGSALPKGAQAYFNYINQSQGGVKSGDGKRRKIDFITVDDQYDPARTVQAFKQLVEEKQVFADVLSLGTVTVSAVRPYVNQQKFPTLFISSGAAMWANDAKTYPWTMGLSPDYTTEGAILGRYLTTKKPNAKIAVLAQAGDVGIDYQAGLKRGIAGTNASIVATETFNPTAAATVDSQMSKLANSGADSLLIISTANTAAQALKKTGELAWHPTVLLVASAAVIKSVLIGAGVQNTTGSIAAGWFKDPLDTQWANDPDMTKYRSLLAQYGPGLDSNDGLVLQGWVGAEMVVEALKTMKQPTRQSFLDSARHLNTGVPLLLPGVVPTADGLNSPTMFRKLPIQRFNGTSLEVISQPVAAP
jgi:branched-chain amino acid transport system substrate-binding protein